MSKSLTTMIAVATLAAGLAAQATNTDAQGLTGIWNMGVQGDHVIPIALVLTQDGDAVTGTLTMPTQRTGQHVDVTLKGRVANGALTLSGTVEHAKEPTTLEIKGKLTDEGVIEGTLAMQGHEMPYTAERLKERK